MAKAWQAFLRHWDQCLSVPVSLGGQLTWRLSGAGLMGDQLRLLRDRF